MHKVRSGGFTLIELMVVIAIVGILVAVALPAYQDYSKRSKMSEVVLAASSCRNTISEVIQSHSSVPGANAWGCERSAPSSRHVSRIQTLANGTVLVTSTGIGPGADGVVSLKPCGTADIASCPDAPPGRAVGGWRCGAAADGSTVRSELLPHSCRGGV